MARLFFALWPQAAAAAALGELAASLAREAEGKPVPESKIHLTLAFLGEVDCARRDAAQAIAAGLHARAFAAMVDCVGSFRGARVAWAGMTQPPEELARLQRDLESRLRESGFALDERPFVAHVTLARRIGRAVARRAIAPIAWDARALALMRSETGTGRYSILESWEFAR